MADSNGGNKQTTQVQLGCGTLILIALIVMIFSNAGDDDDAQREIQQLRDQVTRIEAKLDSLNARLARPAAP